MKNVIKREILIEAPVDIVWQMITESDHLNGWFTDHNAIEVRPGGNGVMQWGERAAKENKAPDDVFAAYLQVVDVDEPNRFAFRWGHPQGKAPTPTNSLLVEFSLLAQGDNSTLLRMVESGMRDLRWPDEDKVSYIKEHEQGWSKHLPDLRTYTLDLRKSQR